MSVSDNALPARRSTNPAIRPQANREMENVMKLFKSLVVAGLLAVSLTVHAMLPGPLVEGDWLKSSLDKPELVVLDVQEMPMFMRHHIPGSINWPFSEWRTDAKAVPPSSLPPIESITKRLGGKGISFDSPVVIVGTGTSSSDMSAAARVYWTLKVLGHEQVAILDGGLLSYVNEYRGGYASGAEKSSRKAVVYEAKPNLALLANAEWLNDSDMQRLDARSLGEHVGLIAGPGERPGTLSGAKHLPFDWLTKNSSGRLRPKAELDRLFEHAGIAGQPAVHFCHTGNRASLTWFVDYALMGNEAARLYDASMIEWGKTDLPIETKLKMR